MQAAHCCHLLHAAVTQHAAASHCLLHSHCTLLSPAARGCSSPLLLQLERQELLARAITAPSCGGTGIPGTGKHISTERLGEGLAVHKCAHVENG